jgi:hypothetical protein
MVRRYKTMRFFSHALLVILAIAIVATVSVPLHAGNGVLGEVELVGTTRIEKTSGVWVDGQYLGYLNELKGSKKILLLPGDHDISVRQGGYLDFTRKVTVRAGEKLSLDVKMEKDTRIQLPQVTAEIKLDVNPNRAAILVDGTFMGHVAEFNGIGKALLVAPGRRHVTVTLPGYQTFDSDIDLVANQKFTLKTELIKGGPATGIAPPPE